VCGQPVRIERYYLAEWRHIALEPLPVRRFRVPRNQGRLRAPIRSSALPGFRMPCRERAVDLVAGRERGDAQAEIGPACAPPRPRAAHAIRPDSSQPAGIVSCRAEYAQRQHKAWYRTK
jgi:hypothetical protein